MCVKYARDRNEMMQVVLKELGNARVKTGMEWMMVLLLRLCGETSERMIEAVKEFLERMLLRLCGETRERMIEAVKEFLERECGMVEMNCAYTSQPLEKS
ncbi:hypothetical protein E2C01_021748 [Portunus trituberculatus]|uniref:Uncharacterized protein n=1 Tax=Portunus trituberculatus TaxID=210409 RepID=A0A5B7E548_PORTR|nr:hypothetical protein [Portunus trituberculatus]